MPDATDKGRSLLTLAAVVASRVRIEGIRLSRCAATSALPAPGSSLRVDFGFNGKATADRESNKIAVCVSLMVRADAPDRPDSPAFQMKAEFVLDYKIGSFEGICDEQVDAFGKMNGIYNAWPYWREYVQSMTPRMGFPALTLPVLTGETIQQMYERQEAGVKTEGDNLPQGPADTAVPAS